MQPDQPWYARAVDLSALRARPAPASANQPSDAGPSGSPGSPAPAGPSDPGGSPHVIDVTEASFQADVLNRSLQVPVVLDLWAEWCGPCKQLGPVLEKLAAEGGGSWILARIDVDANPGIAQALRVQGIPAVKAVYQGQLVSEFTGALPESQVRQWIGAILEAVGGTLPEGAAQPEQPEPEDPRLIAAEEAAEGGDYDAAAKAYREILDTEPAHPLAGAALRQVELLGRLSGHGADAVARADARPADLDAQLAAADLEVAEGDAAAGFARLVATVRSTAGDDRDRARVRLLELFVVVGDDDPRVLRARRNLASALF